MNYTISKVGQMGLEDSVDVTDPCYKKSERCRITLTNLLPGAYDCWVMGGRNKEGDQGTWGLAICHETAHVSPAALLEEDWEVVKTICVDSGLAGFFHDKPDFVGSQWGDLIDWMSAQGWGSPEGPGYFFKKLEGRDAFWAPAGYGDGAYPASVRRDSEGRIIALRLLFEE